jgi:hypothetical protein
MNIACIDNSIIPNPTCDLILNNILHVPSSYKNLISVHRFTLDNDTFIEFHPFFLFSVVKIPIDRWHDCLGHFSRDMGLVL